MLKSFKDMVAEAKATVPSVTPADAHRRLREDPNVLLVELADGESVPVSDRAPNVVMMYLGTLPVRADPEVPEEARDPPLQNRSRQVITTGRLGNMAALGASILKEMGFTNVTYMDGGMKAWREAGLPTITWAGPS